MFRAAAIQPTREVADETENSAEGAAKPKQGIAGLAERVYQLFGRQALEELFEIPPTSAPVRAAITEPQWKKRTRVGDHNFGICFSPASSAAESEWNLCFRESAIGARSRFVACDQRSVSEYFAAIAYSRRCCCLWICRMRKWT